MDFTFWDIVRNLLMGLRWTAALSIVAFIGGGLIGFLAPAAQAAPPAAPGSPVKGGSSTSLLGFAGVPVSKDDTFVVPEAQMRDFLRDRKGCIVGRKLADTSTMV